ncbi:MAG: membrane dipeptidase [Staphylothermus sp.]|nr:membrane dipeptidase [Staphylothermus sp.]
MDVPLIDLHEDISLYYMTASVLNPFPLEPFDMDTRYRHADIPKYRRANTRMVVGAVFPGLPWYSNGRITFKHYPKMDIVLEHLKLYRMLIRSHKELVMVTNYSVLQDLVYANNFKVGIMLGLEGADPIYDVNDLELLYDLGLRVLGLTWNYNNRYAASCKSKVDSGLTREGVKLIEKALELGVAVDLAHASRNTVEEVYYLTKKPIIVSHANARHICNVDRNLGDKTLEIISSSKGVIGITFIEPFVSKSRRASIEDLIKHIMYIKDNYGVDIISIGSDYFGSLNLNIVTGLETIDKINALWKTLLEQGLSKHDIRKIAYENALRALKNWIK